MMQLDILSQPQAPHRLHSSISGRSINEFYAYENGIPLNNRYKKIKNIQDGSYGKVSVALDQRTNTRVAVKSMDKKINGVCAVARHEISILKRLGQHENICSLLDFFESQSHYYLIFEYCEHGDLYDYLKNSSNHINPNFKNGSPLIFKQFVKELTSAINYAHSKNVYHRDIKPENVLIDANGTVKLTDWGLATICSQVFDPCVGTEKYMAPETFFKRAKDSKKMISYDARLADYWSLGITLLYTLFGSCPFKIASFNDENYREYYEDYGYMLKMYPNLSMHGFKSVVLNLLQLNPSRRSLNNCLLELTSDYTSGLTIEQEIEKLANQTDSFIFGMDDSSNNELYSTGVDEHFDMEESNFRNLAPQALNSFVPSQPPSLMGSVPNDGFSWIDDAHLSMESFKIQHLNSNELEKNRGTPLKFDTSLNW